MIGDGTPKENDTQCQVISPAMTDRGPILNKAPPPLVPLTIRALQALHLGHVGQPDQLVRDHEGHLKHRLDRLWTTGADGNTDRDTDGMSGAMMCGGHKGANALVGMALVTDESAGIDQCMALWGRAKMHNHSLTGSSQQGKHRRASRDSNWVDTIVLVCPWMSL